MNGNSWCQYTQQPFVNSGSHLPRSALPHEDHTNNYGCGNSNGLLLSSQDAQSHASRNGIDPPTNPTLPNSNYDTNFSSKETNEYTLFSACKENQTGLQNFVQMQSSVSRNEGNNFPNSDTSNYAGQVPSISFNSSNLDHPSPGPFGVLPHEAVMPRVDRFDRSNENFISPVPKTASYNNGPYLDRDATNVYSTAPLSVQSAFSGDTASLSPRVNSNFSSPSDYYSSPKTTFGAYNSLQSPMPQSPSVAQHSYPSSPFTNVDPNNHISSAPPCSPLNGGSYVNNLNGVPARMGQKTQHSPSATSNALCYNAPQQQNLAHHGPQSMLPKTMDYHPEYGVYPPDQNSSSFSSAYPPIHSGQMSNGNNSRLSPRTPSHLNSISHEGRLRYGHSGSIPSATISSPTYLQNKVNHERTYGSCSSTIPPGQSMHPPKFPTPSMNNHMSNSCQQIPSSMAPNHIGHDRQFRHPSTNVVDDKGALDLFNSHVDSGAHNQDTTISNFLENDLQILGPETVTTRQLRSSKNNITQQNRSTNYTKSELHSAMVSENSHQHRFVDGRSKYSYGSTVEQGGRDSAADNFPRRRGRRGRRRKADINSGSRLRTDIPMNGDRNIFRNEARSSSTKMSEYERFYVNRTQRLPNERFFPPTLTPPVHEILLDNEPGEGPSGLGRGGRIRKKYTDPYGHFMVCLEIFHLQDSPLHERRRTRKTDKKESGFQEEYLQFLKREICFEVKTDNAAPEKKTKHKKHHKKKKYQEHNGVLHKMSGDTLKLKLKMSENNGWYCTNLPEPNTGVISSTHIKKENDSEQESNHETTGNLSKLRKKFSESSAKKEFDNFNDLKENHSGFTNNSKTLPAGKMKTKSDKASASANSEAPHNKERKKGGRRRKVPTLLHCDSNTEQDVTSVKTSDESGRCPVTIKQEIIELNDIPSESLRTLRSRRSTCLSKDSEPGPSVKVEVHDLSSDDYENFDDTDSDPVWTPSSKTAKPGDSTKSLGGSFPGRKRGPKRGQRASANNSPPAKKRRTQPRNTRPTKKPPEKLPTGIVIKKEPSERRSKGREPKEIDRFLIAKADINAPTPFIWKVDSKSSMLQRFEISEQNGVLLYHSSFTYAAGNEISVNNYVTANVRVKSPDTVQYLGPNLSESAALSLSQMKPPVPVQKEYNYLKENFDNLRDDFTVYIQSLLSQDVDSSFFYEIKKFNDEYFLVPIKNLDSISEKKSSEVIKDLGDEELKKCANTYPCVNMLNSHSDIIKCHVCEKNKGNKLLQFSGQPYDRTTLGSLETNLVTKTQFNVCDKCSAAISVFHRLHHYKYNLFVKCHSKASEVRNKNNVESHEDVLKLCLEDAVWIEEMFGELTDVWHEADENS